MHRVINEDVINMLIMMNNTDKMNLQAYEQLEISILSQLIPSGLGNVECYIIKVSLPLNFSLSGKPGVMQMHLENE